MIEQFLKENKKKLYLFLISGALLFSFFFSFQNLSSIKEEKYTSIENQIIRIDKNMINIKKEIERMRKQKVFYNSKVIKKNKLEKELHEICNFLTKNNLVKKCVINLVVVPVEYINVANVDIQTESKQDDLIIHWFLKKNYHLKSFISTSNGVAFEIYKDVK